MKWAGGHGAPLAVAVIAALGLALGAMLIRSHTNAGPVYPVSVVDAGLIQHPRAWVGRTVRVSGMVTGTWCAAPAPCMRGQGTTEELYSVQGGGRFILAGGPISDLPTSQPSLLLALAPQQPVLAALRNLPLGGDLFPSAQRFTYGVGTVLQVRLQSRQCPYPWVTRRWCEEGVVLDGGPPVPAAQ